MKHNIKGLLIEPNKIDYIIKVSRTRFNLDEPVEFEDDVYRYEAKDYGIKIVFNNGNSETVWWNAKKRYDQKLKIQRYRIAYDDRDTAFAELEQLL